MSAAEHRSQDGFTLLEVLVTLVLAALLLAGMPSALRLANSGMKHATAALSSDETERALDLIEQKLSGAIPIFQHSADGLLKIAFQGNAQSVSFVAPLLHASDSGLFRYTVSAETNGEGNDVVLTLQPFRPDAGDLPVVERRILKRNCSLTLRYLGPATNADGPQWASEWKTRDNLPRLVAFTISQPRSTQSRVVEFRLRSRSALN